MGDGVGVGVDLPLALGLHPHLKKRIAGGCAPRRACSCGWFEHEVGVDEGVGNGGDEGVLSGGISATVAVPSILLALR